MIKFKMCILSLLAAITLNLIVAAGFVAYSDRGGASVPNPYSYECTSKNYYIEHDAASISDIKVSAGYVMMEYSPRKDRNSSIFTQAFGWPFQWVYMKTVLPFKNSQASEILGQAGRTTEGCVTIPANICRIFHVTDNKVPYYVKWPLFLYSLSGWWIAIFVFTLVLLRLRWLLRNRFSRCVRCGYCIKGLQMCPECGYPDSL